MNELYWYDPVSYYTNQNNPRRQGWTLDESKHDCLPNYAAIFYTRDTLGIRTCAYTLTPTYGWNTVYDNCLIISNGRTRTYWYSSYIPGTLNRSAYEYVRVLIRSAPLAGSLQRPVENGENSKESGEQRSRGEAKPVQRAIWANAYFAGWSPMPRHHQCEHEYKYTAVVGA